MASARTARTARPARGWLDRLRRPVIALDLGQEAFRLACAGGVAAWEVPARVAWDPQGKAAAVGGRALALEACLPPGWRVAHPVARGAPADPEAARLVLGHLLAPLRRHNVRKPEVWVAEPTGATPLEQQVLRQLLQAVQARSLHWCTAARAVAAAAGVDATATPGLLVIDLGAGHTSAAVLAHGHAVAEARWPEGGSDWTLALRAAIEAQCGVWVSPATADGVKRGRGEPLRGLSRLDGTVREVVLPPGFAGQALAPHIDRLGRRVEDLLDTCSPELRLEVLQRGAVLAGSGSLLPGLAELLGARLTAPADVCAEPGRATLNGLLHLAGAPARPATPLPRRHDPDLAALNADL